MATDDKKPCGQLTLVDYYYETSSTHYDKTRRVTLTPGDGNDVLLTDYQEENNQYRMSPTVGVTNKWSISREQLISLIQEHGKPVR